MAINSRYKLKTGEEVAYFPPIQNTANPYLTEAAMHLDQANQLQGYGYLVDGVGAFTYLGTLAGTAADYEGFGGGTGMFEPNVWRPKILSGNTAQQNADLINADINSAKLVGGVVILPAGSFTSRKILWDPRVLLKGAGKRATKITGVFAEPLIEYTGNTWYFPIGNIEGMTLWGGVDADNKISTSAFNIQRVTYFHFKNILCEFFNGNALELMGCLIGQFEDVNIHRCIGGVKAIKASTSSIGALQSNLVIFKNCSFQLTPTWAVQWDRGSSIQFTDGCDFEACGTNGDLNTGIIKATNMCPASAGSEGIGLVIDRCWGEFNYGTMFSIQSSMGNTGKHIVRDSMFQYGTPSKAIDFNEGELLIDNSNILGGITIINGKLETTRTIHGDVTLQNLSTWKKYNVESLTGTVLNLANTTGDNYNYTTPSASTSYTTINKVNNAFVSCSINAAAEPTITGATKISGAAFLSDTNMEMVVEVKNEVVRYFFLNI